MNKRAVSHPYDTRASDLHVNQRQDINDGWSPVCTHDRQGRVWNRIFMTGVFVNCDLHDHITHIPASICNPESGNFCVILEDCGGHVCSQPQLSKSTQVVKITADCVETNGHPRRLHQTVSGHRSLRFTTSTTVTGTVPQRISQKDFATNIRHLTTQRLYWLSLCVVT